MYRWEHLGKSSLLAEESVALGHQPCSPLPAGAPLLPLPTRPSPRQCQEPSCLMPGALPPLLSSLGWEGLMSGRTQAGSHRTVLRSAIDPGPGGELNSQLQGEVKNRQLSQPAQSWREAPLPGLLMDPMQNCRLCSVQAPVPVSAERLGPGRKDPRQGVVGLRVRSLPPWDLWGCP